MWSTCECVYYCANRLLLSDIAIEKALKVFSQPNMFAGKIRKHKHTFGIGRVNLLLFYRPAFSYAIRMHSLSFLPSQIVLEKILSKFQRDGSSRHGLKMTESLVLYSPLVKEG